MNKYNTILGQLLEGVNRPRFQALVKKYEADRYYKKITAWNQFVTMIFAVMSNQSGLRSTVNALNREKSSFYHLNLNIDCIKKSTLAYANENRPCEFWEEVFYMVCERAEKVIPEENFSFKNPLYAIDGSTLDLNIDDFEWAEFRTTKSGVKMLVKYDLRRNIPTQCDIKNAKEHENQTLTEMKLYKGDIGVFDRGYFNFETFEKFCKEGILFVTRLKDNTKHETMEEIEVPKRKEFKNILSDEKIKFTSKVGKEKCPSKLRKIVSVDEKTGKKITLLTNIFDMDSSEIAAIYRRRWRIELFFKSIKQNVKIKKFFGQSENAVKTQIWIAMIVYLLFAILTATMKGLSPESRCFTRFLCEIQFSLFRRISILDWLFHKIPDKTDFRDSQPRLPF